MTIPCGNSVFPSHVKIVKKNNVSTIILLGFQHLHILRIPFFIFLLVIYIVTVGGNILIITLVSYCRNLKSPMYFFLTQLSISDILLTTDIVPNLLYVVLNDGATISFTSCLVQFYFFGSALGSECLLLTVMAYDRYLAICKPLHYTFIMDHILCLKLATASWLFSLSATLVITCCISQLQFCGQNVIDDFFCDLDPILQLSSSDVSTILMVTKMMCISDIVCPLFFIFVSYVYIVSVISKISTITGRCRSFSTCSSHLTVVAMFYGTLTATYVLPNQRRLMVVSKVLSMLYTVFIPFLNPCIYSFRNNDIKEAVVKVFSTYRQR